MKKTKIENLYYIGKAYFFLIIINVDLKLGKQVHIPIGTFINMNVTYLHTCVITIDIFISLKN